MSREQKVDKDFVKIVSDKDTGKVSLRQEVPEGTEGSEKRDWTVGEKSGTKHEIVFSALAGIIENVEIKTSKFEDGGSQRNLYLTIRDEQGLLVLTDKTTNRFATDILKKLPNMDFSKVYRFAPYSFKGDEGNLVKGITISEGETYVKDESVKVDNFFWDGKKSLNGMPETKKPYDELTENQKKAYYGEVEDFLVDYAEKNVVTKFEKEEKKEEIDIEEVAEDINSGTDK